MSIYANTNELQIISPVVKIGEPEIGLGKIIIEIVNRATMPIKFHMFSVDGISKTTLIQSLPKLLKSMTELINKSTRDFIFPDIWKEAIIIPIKYFNDRNLLVLL